MCLERLDRITAKIGGCLLLSNDEDGAPIRPAFIIPLTTESTDNKIIYWKAAICAQILSYLPYISIIVGIARITFATLLMMSTDHPRLLLGTHIIRGILEVACLGIGLIIADIAYTCFHTCLHKPETEASKTS
ncbi:MAG: hypothetical protein H0X51_09275 [Parachlamydiaceae bacterium]|nr:hypothetical protein [Parachlamydiaceae bacterium]